MKAIILSCLALLSAAALVAAQTPKSAPDPRKESDASEPAEPAIDPDKAKDSAVLRVRDATNRTTSSNNLKEILLAVHNFHSANDRFPSDFADKDGKPLLSWRVLLLPFLEDQAALFKEFRFDEPWDGPNNSKLIEKMPKVYTNPRVVVKKKGYTVYQGFAGPQTVLDPSQRERIKLTSVTDGNSNTLFAVEASTAVPWTKPADMPFDPKKDLPDFGKAYGQRPIVAFCDGSVRVLDIKKNKPETIKLTITRDDGKPFRLED
jgi:hypothetical protein